MLSYAIDYKGSRLSAYADDLAVVLHCLWHCLPLLEEAFQVVSQATTLELNFGKCVLVPLFRRPLARIAEQLEEIGSSFADVKLQYFAKHMLQPHPLTLLQEGLANWCRGIPVSKR